MIDYEILADSQHYFLQDCKCTRRMRRLALGFT